MHDFKYKKNELFCEGVAIRDIAEKVGTPFYCYSYKTMTERFLDLKKAYALINPLICFSVKSNSNAAIIKALVKKGAGLDIVSGGELYRGLKVGCAPQKIVFAGVGKTEKEIKDAIKAGILLFNVESEQELCMISHVAEELKKKTNVSIRINPDVDAGTHAYITTAKAENKFGVNLAEAEELLVRYAHLPFVSISGIHIHIGSQITKTEPFVEAITKTLKFMDRMKEKGIVFTFLNLGGGIGITYKDEKPPTPAHYARKILPLIKTRGYKIIFEPGRYIVGNAGAFVTKVTYEKKALAKNFLIVDGAMNDLVRPSLYKAYHEAVPVTKTAKSEKLVYDVVGPICESGDFLAKERELEHFRQNDLMAFLGAGAYGFAMSSNYNSRPRVAEVLVKGKSFYVVRKREKVEDLTRGEIIPSFLQ
jgi:diaminopimelate decarboxylase